MDLMLAKSKTKIVYRLLRLVGCFFLIGESPAAIPQEIHGIEPNRAPTPGLSTEDIESGWLSLFDGESLFGWRVESEANWEIDRGIIRVSSGEPGLLRTTTQFDHFDLRLEFRAPANTNSGVFIHTSPNPSDPTVDCYEVNIARADISPFPTGSIVGRHRASNFDLNTEQWSLMRIVAEEARIRCWVNGELVSDYRDERAQGPLGKGYIGLQFNAGRVEFRNLRLLPLSLQPIPLSKDLAAWNTDLTMESEFSVTDQGELQIRGGRGQLESNGLYADFIFSMQCRTNAEGLNSGIFFRSIPGELMNGYESQIQNQFHDNDRRRPVDCGTGGIFRRSEARFVNADDNQWFTKTIIADGPHVAVWVNGYQVTDWSDRRQPDANPRRGLRREAGSIIIQGHDPTTDILMRSMMIRSMESRNR